MLRRAPHLPDTLIRLSPPMLQVPQYRELERPTRRVGSEPAFATLMQDIDQLAINIELELSMRIVADANRRGALVSWQPGKLPFHQPPFAGESVHDLHLIWTARDGAQQPVSPGAGFVIISGIHECKQRQSGVSQPAVPVIPVMLPTQLFW